MGFQQWLILALVKNKTLTPQFTDFVFLAGPFTLTESITPKKKARRERGMGT